jgi:hypothetical protein
MKKYSIYVAHIGSSTVEADRVGLDSYGAYIFYKGDKQVAYYPIALTVISKIEELDKAPVDVKPI